jgi:hypothetical protein
MTSRKLRRRLEDKGLVVRHGAGDHLVVMDPEGSKILGTFGYRGSVHGRRNRAYQNLRSQIRRATGIDIDS